MLSRLTDLLSNSLVISNAKCACSLWVARSAVTDLLKRIKGDHTVRTTAADNVEGSLRGLASTAVWPGRSPHRLRGCCLQIKELLQDLERLLQVRCAKCRFRRLGVSHIRG